MSNVDALLLRLAEAGISVTPRGGMLILNPRDLVTDAIAAEVRSAKPEIMARLTAWDGDHAHSVIAEMLQRIEARFPQDAVPGTTHDDDQLVELEAAVNEAAQARDRVAFDEALRAYERHVTERYCTGARAGSPA